MGIKDRVFAAVYDSLNEPLQRLFGPYRERTAGQAKGKVLEIGAGTGASLPYYSPEVRLTAVEPNPHMAKRLVAKARDQGREVMVVRETVESLPFEDDSFDSVVSTTTPCSVTDVSKALLEISRVLKPGGVLYFHEHVAAKGGWVRKVQD
jgi:ubiquinone/menaquinone biosynthesis C-methylase UbiE